MTLRRTLAAILVVLLLAVGAYVVFAWRFAIRAIEPPRRSSFDAALVEKGAALARDFRLGELPACARPRLSWTLFESVAFDEQRITSRDWSSYPILRFPSVPERIEVRVVNRPGEPFLGTGEAALANAVADATGARIRDLPLTRQRVHAAIGI